MRRRTQRFLALDPETAVLQVRQEPRLVLLLAWETLFPTIGRLPVTSPCHEDLDVQPATARDGLLTRSRGSGLALKTALTSPSPEGGPEAV